MVILGSDRGLDAPPERPAGWAAAHSDLAIETALTLRLLYHLPLRQAEGFLHALFGMMRLNLSAPDSTTLSRRRWKKASGYHRQGRVENTFFRYKSIIGDGLRARSPAGQGSEAVLGCEILNRMTRPGYFVHPRRMRPAYAALR